MPVLWMKFPRSHPLSKVGSQIVGAFEAALPQIDSALNELKSNDVLAVLAPRFSDIGFEVENSGGIGQIRVPVFFGENGRIEKTHSFDAYDSKRGYLIEVEAGAAVSNNRYLVDLMKACTTPGAQSVCIAVRRTYKNSNNYGTVVAAIETIYASGRLTLPLDEVLVVGY